MVAAFVIPKSNVKTQNLSKAQDSKADELSGAPELGVKTVSGNVLSTDQVRTWVLEKLSHHLVPKYVFWVDEYPKTASGKIQKFKLREIGMELVNEGKGI